MKDYLGIPHISSTSKLNRDNTTWYEKEPYFWNPSEQSEFQKIIDGYREGSIEEVKWQEITFICDEYYMLDLEYYNKIIEYCFN